MTDEAKTTNHQIAELLKAVRSRGIYVNVADLSLKLENLRQDMADAGFFKTYQALDAAVKQLGWEAAEQLEKTP